MINISQFGFRNCQLYLAIRTLRTQCFVVRPYASNEEYRLINKSMKYPPLTSPAVMMSSDNLQTSSSTPDHPIYKEVTVICGE